MIEVIIAPQARDDLIRIVDYLSDVSSPTTAKRWNDRLWSTIEGISEHPGSGPLRPRLGRHVRIKVVRPYIIVYEHERGAGATHVLRVVHGRR